MSVLENANEIDVPLKKGDEELQAIQNVGNYGIARKKSGFTLKRVLLGLAILVVVGLIAFVVWQVVRSKYTDAIDKQIEILNSRDANLKNCLDASVGEMKKQFVMEYGDFIVELDGNCDEWNERIKEVFTNQYETLEKSFGEDFKVSYEIVEETHLTTEELKYYYEDIGDYLTNKIYDGIPEDLSDKDVERLITFLQKWVKAYREVEVTDGYSAIVEVNYKSSGETKTVKTRMVVVQINGEWIVRVGGLLPLDSAGIFENMEY